MRLCLKTLKKRGNKITTKSEESTNKQKWLFLRKQSSIHPEKGDHPKDQRKHPIQVLHGE